ncbi:SDR family NAD(P)-dependent oxidoreductase [Metabacillus litoralis]|uniref:SDR family NAD(P)-dependent oxidoreductase n=1 Tax=Metabacillus litoralis TaxID=152268 RepID=UPI00204074E2|nr:SDR family NAD(P)-dependent oxidoreductase [Metabacillus litoralis]MCM3654515.1 SDR family NAD(P)-dependent oxidoreductase [Metabacillus litoralis]
MFFKNKKILVIGGTGTIGKSIVNTILEEEPSVIRIISRDEYKQFQLQNDLGNRKNLHFIIGDVRDFDRVYNAMQDVDYVFHLAAMKHVSSCEYNPYEAVLTNVLGTYNVIKAAISQNVKKVVFTSSDKAISPTNTYGATKLTAERLISSAHYNNGKGKTVFASVRFGNVMGSRGSVIPLFKKQILENRKITITDRKMTRFMMTLTQANQLTIKALQKAKGGEVFVLKMPVISLGSLASIIIEETCKKNGFDKTEVEIEEIGLRPGEKMYEELMTYDESMLALELSDMYIIPGKDQVWINDQDSKKAKHGNYSSESQKPLSLEELQRLLRLEKLI